MASIQLQHPPPFDFAKPDEWSRWKRRFEQYHHTFGLSSEDDMRQVGALLYCLGQEADDMLSSTGITEEECKKYNTIMQKFDDYF